MMDSSAKGVRVASPVAGRFTWETVMGMVVKYEPLYAVASGSQVDDM